MSIHLDHAVIAVTNLEAAIQHYHSLGFSVRKGGVHANQATQNALITFANGTYLELLAATGTPPRPGLIDFSAMLRNGEGLAGFALRADDLAADAVWLREQGFGVNAIIPGERRRDDGTLIQWELALLDEGFTPFLIADITPRARRIPINPAFTQHNNAVIGLGAVEIAVHDLSRTQSRYASLFDAEPRPLAEDRVSIGDVILHALTTTQQAEQLSALHLLYAAGSEPGVFPPEHTHGVRFEVCPG